MKATAAGKIMGYVLAPTTKDGTVLLFVQSGYYDAPGVDSLQAKLLRRENAQLRAQLNGLASTVRTIRARLDDAALPVNQVCPTEPPRLSADRTNRKESPVSSRLAPPR